MKKSLLIIILLMTVFFTPSFVFAENDVTSLTVLRDQVNNAISNQTGNYYETDSYSAFYNELTTLGGIATIDNLITDPLALQTDIDQMVIDLERILGYLTTSTTYEEVSLAYFQEKSRNLTGYTERSITLYNDELLRIKTIIDNPISGESIISLLFDDITNVSDLLVMLGNKDSLNATFLEAQGIYNDGSLYLPITYELFLSAYDEIDNTLIASIGFTKQEVVDNLDASQSEVDETERLIQEALNLLILKPDKTSFFELYDSTVDALDLSLYIPNSLVDYFAEIERINDLVGEETTTEEQLAEYIIDFDNAYLILIEKADILELDRLNSQAIIAYYEEKSLYTSSSYLEFKEAVLEYGSYLYINERLADPNILQSEVDSLSLVISDALNLLKTLEDNSDLLVLFQEAVAKVTINYTPVSILLYTEELDRIYEKIISDELDRTLYIQILTDLSLSELLLVDKADISELTELYTNSLGFEAEDYSISSFAYLAIERENTANLLLDENIDQISIDYQYAKLSIAINSLQKPTKLITIYDGDSFNILSYITLGDALVENVVSSNPNAVTIVQNETVFGIRFGESDVTVQLDNGVSETITVLVKANIITSTFALAILVPIVSLGSAAALLFLKPSSVSWVKKIVIFRRKK